MGFPFYISNHVCQKLVLNILMLIQGISENVVICYLFHVLFCMEFDLILFYQGVID